MQSKLGILLLMAASWNLRAIPSFPGAEGWGAATPGGRGGKVLMVTNTNASGPGSFMAALMTPGPRTIIFRTSGVINLTNSYGGFEPSGPYSNLTVAGQTSPGGITFTGAMTYGGSIWWCYNSCRTNGFHDGIIRFLRFRGNDGNQDGFTLEHGHRFILDHCSFSGASDETLDLAHDSTYTVQWCNISNSSAASGSQTYGFLAGYEEFTHVSLHHNFFAHHVNRGGPAFHFGSLTQAVDFGQFDYVNNVCYDVYQQMVYDGYENTVSFRMNIVGNYMKWGPNTADRPVEKLISISAGLTYCSDNTAEYQDGSKKTDQTYGTLQAVRWNMPQVTTLPADSALSAALRWSGAFPRDAMDARTEQEARTKTGTYGKLDDALTTGGPAAPADADNDGMPDFWETGMGFNPNDSMGKNDDPDGDGYTNVEEYINDLALARLCQDYYNPVYPIPGGWPDYNPACSKSLALDGLPAREEKGYAMQISPNPFFGGLVNLRLPDRQGEIRILDVQGRLVKTLSVEKNLNWNGGDNAGKRLAQGVFHLYWVVKGKVKGRQQMVVLN